MPQWWKLIVLAPALAAAGCGEGQASKAPEIRPVRTLVVEPRSIEDDRRAIGEVRPRYESDLGFRVSGKVIARNIDVGVAVKKGELLARLDDQDYRNKLASAESDIVGADAVLIEAQTAEWRLRHLLANGNTTRANYDVALKNLRSAEAKLDSAKAALNLAKDQVGYSQLYADCDGIVTAVGAEAGQVVNVGQMIVRLARPSDKDAVFSIAESVFAERRDDSERPQIIAALLSNPDIFADGVVREVSPVA